MYVCMYCMYVCMPKLCCGRYQGLPRHPSLAAAKHSRAQEIEHIGKQEVQRAAGLRPRRQKLAILQLFFFF